MIQSLSSLFKEIAKIANEAGLAEPYLVGGAIRDMSLGLSPVDFDITCGNKDSLKLARALSSAWGVPVYEMGSGALKLLRDGVELDFSPNMVLPAFQDQGLEGETRSRDFTVNSILLRLSDGEILDFCGGVKDLADRRLRLCSPDSFTDPRRLLRALRFIAEGYEADEELVEKLVENFDKVNKIKGRHAKSLINAAIRKNPEILLFLKEKGLLSKIPLSKLTLDHLRQKRMIGDV